LRLPSRSTTVITIGLPLVVATFSALATNSCAKAEVMVRTESAFPVQPLLDSLDEDGAWGLGSDAQITPRAWSCARAPWSSPSTRS
jgi:hypothetical protein